MKPNSTEINIHAWNTRTHHIINKEVHSISHITHHSRYKPPSSLSALTSTYRPTGWRSRGECRYFSPSSSSGLWEDGRERARPPQRRPLKLLLLACGRLAGCSAAYADLLNPHKC